MDTCCFPSIDAAKVTIQLNTLKESLKPYIKADDLDKLFCTGQSLIFCGQVAPMPKGRLHLPRTEVPDHIQQSAQCSLQKLYTPMPKRIAVELGSSLLMTATNQVTPRHIQVTKPASAPGAQEASVPTAVNTTIRELNSQSQDFALKTLEWCCTHLAATTEQLALEVKGMNADFNQKFPDIHNTLDKLVNSPSHHVSKHHKDCHGLVDENILLSSYH
jgi:hypothetical protein